MTKNTVAVIDQNKDAIVISFADKDGTKLEFNPQELSQEMKDRLMYHGAIQKIRDSYAGAKGDTNLAIANASSVIEGLLAGEWNRRGGGTGGTLLVEAIARIKGYEQSEAREKVAELSEEQREALKKSPTVAAAIAEIQAERRKAKGGDDSALDLI